MIILFGGSGTLGEKIVSNISKKSPIIIVVNNSYEKVKRKFKKNNAITVFKVDVSNVKELDLFLKISIKKYLNNIKGIILNHAKTTKKNNFFYSEEAELIFKTNYGSCANIFSFFTKLNNKLNSNLPLRVVVILTNSIKTLNASNIHYVSSKNALKSLSNYYAKNFANKMIINNVYPGLMKSSLTELRFNAVKKEIVSKTPINRLATPTEIAKLIEYFSLEVPKSVNGQSIYIDGGRTI